MSIQAGNPYEGLTFFSILWQLLIRLGEAVQGKLSFNDLVSDEIQIIVLMGVAASAALVGTFLVLRKMTMLANAISHTILLGIVLAFVFVQPSLTLSEHETISIPVMLMAAFLTGLGTSLLTEFLTRVVRLQEDASIGLVFTGLFALGLVLVTLLTRQAHIGAEVVMGNVDALQLEDCKLVGIIFLLNLFLIVCCFKEFTMTTFDPYLAQALGYSVSGFNYLLMAQTSATVVGGFRAVGVLMVLALMTAPILTARLLSDNLKHLVFLAAGLGCLGALLGVVISRHLLSAYGIALSTGGIVVCCLALIFALVVLARTLWDKRRN